MKARGSWLINRLALVTILGLCLSPLTVSGQQVPVFRANDLRKFIGTNLNWVYDGDGLRLSEAGQPSGVVDSLIRSLGYTALRIPGGTLARTFRWRLAVDSPRGRGVDYAGQPQVISTGLPEFKRLAARYQLEILYTVNIDDTPADVVELVNRWKRLPPVGAVPIRYLELGNEDYSYDGSTKGAERYSNRILPIVAALRANHPEIKVGAQLANNLGAGWDEVVNRRIAEKIDFWSWHVYLPYTPYDSVASYQVIIDGMTALDRDFEARREMQKNVRRPVWLTEYNLMFHKRGAFQNVALQPRYYLLLGDYLFLSIKYGVTAMFKWCLSNPGWHAFADIDFAGTRKAGMSLSGQVSQFLNQWLVIQDSIAAVPRAGSFAQRSIVTGKDARGVLSFLVQNHTSDSVTVGLPVPVGYRWDSSEALFADGPHLSVAHSASAPRPPGTAVQVGPNSITAVRFQRTSP